MEKTEGLSKPWAKCIKDDLYDKYASQLNMDEVYETLHKFFMNTPSGYYEITAEDDYEIAMQESDMKMPSAIVGEFIKKLKDEGFFVAELYTVLKFTRYRIYLNEFYGRQMKYYIDTNEVKGFCF